MSSKDLSEFRIYRNKIDRRQVDFLLCDPKSLRRLADIELNDNTKCATQRPPIRWSVYCKDRDILSNEITPYPGPQDGSPSCSSAKERYPSGHDINRSSRRR
jgi:hypothetical protein